MNEVVFLTILAVAGAAALLPIRRLMPDWQIVLLAPVVGQIIWVFVGIVWLVSPFDFTPRRVLVTVVCGAAFAVGLAIRPGRALHTVFVVGGAAVLSASVISLVVAVNPSTATNDSYWLITIAKALTTLGFDADADLIVLRSFALFPSLVQTGATPSGVDYLVAAPAHFNIFGLAVLFSMLGQDLVRLGTARRRAALVATLAAVAFVTSVHGAFQVFYIRGNLEFGIALALFAVMAWRWSVTGDRLWWPLALAMLVAATLLRVEAPIFLLPYLAVFVLVPTQTARGGKMALTAAYAVFIVVIYGGVFLVRGKGNVLDGMSIVAILAAALVLPVLAAFRSCSDAGRVRLQTAIARSIIPALILAGIATTVARPSWMLESAANTLRVLFIPTTGLWGGLWPLLAISALILWRAGRPLPYQVLLSVPITSGMLIIYTLAYFTGSPWEGNWAASQNRLSVATLLPALYVVLLRAAPLLTLTRAAADEGTAEGDGDRHDGLDERHFQAHVRHGEPGQP